MKEREKIDKRVADIGQGEGEDFIAMMSDKVGRTCGAGPTQLGASGFPYR